jgi:hypothetical protein
LLFFGAHAGKRIVGRIAKDNENRGVAFNVLGGITLLFELGEEEMSFGPFRRLPASEGVGQKDANSLVAFFGQGGTEVLEQKADLEMRDHKWSGEKLEAEDAVLGGFLEVGSDEGVVAVLLLESFVNLA